MLLNNFRGILAFLNFLIIGVFISVPVQAQSLTEFFAQQPGNHSSNGFDPTCARTDTATRADGLVVVSGYYSSGQKKWEVPYQNLKEDKLHGTLTHWFENGQVQAVEEFADNHRHGQLLTYYPTGQIRRREQYTAGKRTAAACFAADGKTAPCSDYLLFPEYPGGLLKLLTTIRDRTNYPRPLIRQGIQGKVKVDFIIDKTGTVQRARVVESVSPELDAEALRVVNSLRGWAPGRLDGEPVDVAFSLPVTFAIR